MRTIYDIQTGTVTNDETWQPELPLAPTPAELDARATAETTKVFEADKRTVALGLVMADILQQASNLTQAQARQQVKTRFYNYYRSLLN